jgi:7,8-dihydro-6-hydroxymethylpterin dimethyltransferase
MDDFLHRTQTESLCPVCLERLPAQRVPVDDEVRLVKSCPRHGTFETVIWRGNPSFDQWKRSKIPGPTPLFINGNKNDKKGCPFDCGLCPDHRQRSCTVIIEVTQRCDLACPVCYADAPATTPDPSPIVIAELFKRAAQTGPGSNIQLSGGEPTVRDDLPALVGLGRDLGFGFIQVNTNGLRLGRDRAYVKALKQAGLASVFLQFDGIEDDIYRRLRGRDLMEAKRAAIEACAEQGIGVVLVPTLVPGVNMHQIGAILEAALSWVPTVRGVHFQPVSYFGRYPATPDPSDRLTLPEVMRAIEEQSDGLFKAVHMGPPGCENALCSFHGRFLQQADGKVIPLKADAWQDCCGAPIKADEGAAKAIASVARQWAGPGRPVREPIFDSSCGCRVLPSKGGKDDSAEPLSMDVFLHQARTHIFSISAMAFQDAWTLAIDRVRDCCIHVMAMDGRLIPFCLYNLTAANGRRLYRQ